MTGPSHLSSDAVAQATAWLMGPGRDAADAAALLDGLAHALEPLGTVALRGFSERHALFGRRAAAPVTLQPASV